MVRGTRGSSNGRLTMMQKRGRTACGTMAKSSTQRENLTQSRKVKVMLLMAKRKRTFLKTKPRSTPSD